MIPLNDPKKAARDERAQRRDQGKAISDAVKNSAERRKQAAVQSAVKKHPSYAAAAASTPPKIGAGFNPDDEDNDYQSVDPNLVEEKSPSNPLFREPDAPKREPDSLKIEPAAPKLNLVAPDEPDSPRSVASIKPASTVGAASVPVPNLSAAVNFMGNSKSMPHLDKLPKDVEKFVLQMDRQKMLSKHATGQEMPWAHALSAHLTLSIIEQELERFRTEQPTAYFPNAGDMGPDSIEEILDNFFRNEMKAVHKHVPGIVTQVMKAMTSWDPRMLEMNPKTAFLHLTISFRHALRECNVERDSFLEKTTLGRDLVKALCKAITPPFMQKVVSLAASRAGSSNEFDPIALLVELQNNPSMPEIIASHTTKSPEWRREQTDRFMNQKLPTRDQSHRRDNRPRGNHVAHVTEPVHEAHQVSDQRRPQNHRPPTSSRDDRTPQAPPRKEPNPSNYVRGRPFRSWEQPNKPPANFPNNFRPQGSNQHKSSNNSNKGRQHRRDNNRSFQAHNVEEDYASGSHDMDNTSYALTVEAVFEPDVTVAHVVHRLGDTPQVVSDAPASDPLHLVWREEMRVSHSPNPDAPHVLVYVTMDSACSTSIISADLIEPFHQKTGYRLIVKPIRQATLTGLGKEVVQDLCTFHVTTSDGQVRKIEALVSHTLRGKILLSWTDIQCLGFYFHRPDASKDGSALAVEHQPIPRDPVDDPFETPELLLDDQTSTNPPKISPKSPLPALTHVLMHGLPPDVRKPEYVERLHTIIARWRRIFSDTLPSTEPMRVPPAQDTITVDPVTIRTHRRFIVDPKAAQWMREHINHLVRLQCIRKAPYAPYACPSQIVLKASKAFRHVVDLRAINAVTQPIHMVLQDARVAMLRVRGSIFFGLLDLCDGFWQVPVRPGTFFFWSNDGIYESRRVLQGARNSTAHLQIALERVLGDLIGRGVEIYVDDILIHAPTFNEYIRLLDAVFSRFAAKNVFLKPSKCTLLAQEVTWCGMVISPAGYKRDPRNLASIMDMESPTNAADLQKALGLFGWMRENIPKYSKLVEPLTDLLTDLARQANTRKSRTLKALVLDKRWTPKHDRAFFGIKSAVQRMPLLHFADSKKTFNLFTDASDTAFGSMLTQTSSNADGLSGDHEVLAFRSGRFSGSELNWATPDKEAYAIVDAMLNLQHLLLISENPIKIFTDHRNLAFLFKPNAIPGPLSTARLGRLERWAVKIQHIPYTIQHVAGTDNGWADLLSRPHDALAVESDVVTGPLDLPPVTHAHLLESHLGLPTLNGAERRDDGLWYVNNRIFVPDVNHLRDRILLLAHHPHHPSADAQYLQMQDRFTWPGMKLDVTNFCSRCYHCLIASSRTVSRPFGHPLHAKEPDRILHFDYLDLPPDEIFGFTKLLVLKDDFTGMVELYPTDSADAEHVAASMCEWFSRHRIARIWVSDNGSHFKNKVMEAVARRLGVNHHFVAPYSPWANGTIERVNRVILRLFRALLSQRRLHESNWLSLLDLIVAAVNMTPSRYRGNTSPFELFTGFPPTTPMDCLFNPDTGILDRPLASQEIQGYLTELRDSLALLHSSATLQMDTRRDTELRRHNQRQSVVPASFNVGDSVLVAQRLAGNKLQAKWLGPARVIRAHPDRFVYDVELDTSPPQLLTRHVSRLLPFPNAVKPGTIIAVQELVKHHTAGRRMVVDLLDIDKVHRRWQGLVLFDGLDPEDAVWMPLSRVHQFVPDKVNAFLASPNLRASLAKSMAAIRQALQIAMRERQCCTCVQDTTYV